MKSAATAFSTIALLACILFAQRATAQNFDVTAVTLNPQTKIFSDGRTTLQGYVLDQLQKKTSCCGAEDIYAEIKYDANGNVTSSRILTNITNECLKSAFAEIMKYVRFCVQDPNGIRPVFLTLRPVIECQGRADENKFTSYPMPAGYRMASSRVACDQAEQPMAQNQPSNPATQPQQNQPANPMPQNNPQQPQQPQQPRQQPQNQQQGRPTNAQASRGREPQQPVEQLTGDPRLDSLLKTFDQTVVRPNPNQDLASNPSLRGNHANPMGPQVSVGFSTSSTATAIYIKKKLRDGGICDKLIHFLVELQLTPDGSVSGVRFLNINDESLRAAVLKVLADMRFSTSGMPNGGGNKVYSLLEFKSFVDCQTNNTMSMSSVPDYILGPDEQGTLAPVQQPNNNNNRIERPVDH